LGASALERQCFALFAKVQANAIGCTDFKRLVSKKYLYSSGINSARARIFAKPRIPRFDKQISDHFICLVGGVSKWNVWLKLKQD
jgi:hypothetical protein